MNLTNILYWVVFCTDPGRKHGEGEEGAPGSQPEVTRYSMCLRPPGLQDAALLLIFRMEKHGGRPDCSLIGSDCSELSDWLGHQTFLWNLTLSSWDWVWVSWIHPDFFFQRRLKRTNCNKRAGMTFRLSGQTVWRSDTGFNTQVRLKMSFSHWCYSEETMSQQITSHHLMMDAAGVHLTVWRHTQTFDFFCSFCFQ